MHASADGILVNEPLEAPETAGYGDPQRRTLEAGRKTLRGDEALPLAATIKAALRGGVYRPPGSWQ